MTVPPVMAFDTWSTNGHLIADAARLGARCDLRARHVLESMAPRRSRGMGAETIKRAWLLDDPDTENDQ